MSDLLYGKPDLKFVISRQGVEIDSFTFDPKDYSEILPTFSPVIIEHELQDYSITQMLKGYRFFVELSFAFADGSILLHLIQLFQTLNSGDNYYDRIQFYPSYLDLPGWSFDILIDKNDITTGYYALLAHKDITIKFKSKGLLDYIPLAQESFLTWGNMTYDFIDLNMDYSTLT